MSDPSPIIDVNPVASTSDAAKSASPSGSDTFRAPSYGKDAAQAAVNATIIDEGRVSKKKPNRIGGAVQTAIGGAIMLVGVPMLILPGPGLLAIGGGAVIAGNGIKKVLGKYTGRSRNEAGPTSRWARFINSEQLRTRASAPRLALPDTHRTQSGNCSS